jgi:hypothetical protein
VLIILALLRQIRSGSHKDNLVLLELPNLPLIPTKLSRPSSPIGHPDFLKVNPSEGGGDEEVPDFLSQSGRRWNTRVPPAEL